MTEIRLHRDLYRGTAVDAAVKVFSDFASFELREDEGHWVVEVSCDSEDIERRVAGELGNYALGLTIRERGL